MKTTASSFRTGADCLGSCGQPCHNRLPRLAKVVDAQFNDVLPCLVRQIGSDSCLSCLIRSVESASDSRTCCRLRTHKEDGSQCKRFARASLGRSFLRRMIKVSKAETSFSLTEARRKAE